MWQTLAPGKVLGSVLATSLHPSPKGGGGGVCIADLGGERGAAGELAPCPPWVEMPLPGSSTRPGSAQLWGARDAQAQTSLQPGPDPTQCSAPSQTTGRAEGAGCRPGAKVSFPPPRFTVPQFPLCKPPTQVRGGGVSLSEPAWPQEPPATVGAVREPVHTAGPEPGPGWGARLSRVWGLCHGGPWHRGHGRGGTVSSSR